MLNRALSPRITRKNADPREHLQSPSKRQTYKMGPEEARMARERLLIKRQKLIARLHSVRVEEYQMELPEISELRLAASESETTSIKSQLTVHKFIRDTAERHRDVNNLGNDRWNKSNARARGLSACRDSKICLGERRWPTVVSDPPWRIWRVCESCTHAHSIHGTSIFRGFVRT